MKRSDAMKTLKSIYVFLIPLILFGCDRASLKSDKGDFTESSSVTSNSSSYTNDGWELFGEHGQVIDGRVWTISDLSDSFDAGLDIEKAKVLFGTNPLVISIDNSVILTYAIRTENLYVPGIRVTTLDLIFTEDELQNVRLGFTNFHDE